MSTATRRDVIRTGATGLVVLMSGAVGKLSYSAQAQFGSAANLDDAHGQWGIYVDPPTRRAPYRLSSAPGRVSGRSLRLRIGGGDPYTGVMCYRQLPLVADSAAFQLDLWWWLSETTFDNEGAPSNIQAVELTMNKWAGRARYEWGMQWLNVGDESAEEGTPPCWRMWDPHGGRWINTGVTQRLRPRAWHRFVLQGDIHGGRVRYVGFRSDGATKALGDSFKPQPVDGEGLTVAFQLDGNFEQGPYECRFDQVRLRWLPSSPWG